MSSWVGERRRGRLVLVLVALAASFVLAPAAHAGVANAGLPGAPASNPLAGMKWGVYRGPLDGIYPAWRSAHGRKRSLLAKIALRPTTRWFGAWDDDAGAAALARGFIHDSTGGHSDELSQVAVFRLDPWEQQACSQLPSDQQQASYRRWIDNFAAGLGSSRVALILQPDLPFAGCAPGGGLPYLNLVNYAARVFSLLAHTTVYIDAGAKDWEPVSKAVSLLEKAGVAYARGFALNDTHYDSTGSELDFGAAVSRALARAHLPGKHFVINTAQNGAPFMRHKYRGDRSNPAVCANRHSHMCVTLGIPPTWQTALARWRLSAKHRRIAASLADAYLWIGRPWLHHGFDLSLALRLSASTPF